MALSWMDASEIAAGLVLEGKIARNAVRPGIFASPYDDIVKTLIADPTVEADTLIEMYGTSTIASMLEAPKHLPDTKVQWVTVLERACNAFQAGADLEKIAKKLKLGEKVDLSSLTGMAGKVQAEQSTRMTLAKDITPRAAAFIESGWPPLDDHMKGLPETGLVVVGARPGTGKTWFALTLVYHFLTAHPDKYGIFFSAEMPSDELRERLNHMTRDGEPDEDVLSRLYIVDQVEDVEVVQNLSATVENLGIVIVDYADMIVKSFDEPAYTTLYLTLAKVAKSLRIPLILLSQLSGSYSGGLPRPQNIRYTRIAEAAAWMIFMLWNPSKDSYEDDGSAASLPVYNNRAYCIAWKSRGGFPMHPDDNPGAILIPFKGESWHPRQSQWFSLTRDDAPSPKRMSKKRSD